MKNELFVAAFCLMCWATPLLAQYTVLVGYDEHQNRRAVKQCLFTTADTAFCNADGALSRSADSGRTWSHVMFTESNAAEWLYFPNAQHGYFMSKRFFKRTTDYGINWETIRVPTGADTFGFVAMGYNSELDVFLLEQDTRHLTTDGGDVWYQEVESSGGAAIRSVDNHLSKGMWYSINYIQGSIETFEALVVDNYGKEFKNLQFSTWRASKGKAFYANLIHAIDTSTVWVAGSYVRSHTDSASWNKRLVFTTNAGTTWQHANYDFPSAITCIEFITPQLGFVGDTTGNVFVTTDGGQTWNNDNAPSGGKPILSISNVLGKYLHIVGRGVVLRRGLSVTDIQETVSPTAQDPLTSVSIRPNPAHATAQLDIVTNGDVVVDIEVYDVVGSRAILPISGVQVANGASAILLDVTTLAAGLYLCLVRTPESVSTYYFMVE